MRKKGFEKDLPVKRPRTLGAARTLIDSVFQENGWDARDRQVYLTMLGISEDTRLLTIESARMILEDMEKTKMILFEQ